MRRLLFAFIILAIVSVLFSEIIHVPTEQSTIQEGINAASNSDTVLVADGVYTGDLNRNLSWNENEKHIVVKSENGPYNCIIDCLGQDRAFAFIDTYQDDTDILEGFTIENGYINGYFNNYHGGAICCHNTSPKILNNVVINNLAAEGCGGAIYLSYSNSKIIGNKISCNNANYSGFPGAVAGGGIYINSSSAFLKNNEIINNTVESFDGESSSNGGGIYVFDSNVTIINNVIDGNTAISGGWGSSGGGVSFFMCDSYDAQLLNNTIINNSADYGGGVYANSMIIINNIIAFNSDGIYCNWQSQTPLIKNNNVWNDGDNFINCPPGIGEIIWGVNINGTACDSCLNISEDPMFISGNEGDYFLSQFASGQSYQSPCVDAGEGLPLNHGLEEFTTRIDLEWDTGFTDIGFHYKGLELVQNEYTVVPYSQSFLTNFPNPFNPSTTISFNVPQTSSFATIEIYNLKGQKVKTINCHPEFIEGSVNKKNASRPSSFDDAQDDRTNELRMTRAGNNQYSVTWNGTDQNNKPVSSGIYFCNLKVDGKILKSKKMMLIK